MPAVTQMNSKHVTPRIWAQEAWGDVTYDTGEEAGLQLRKADWGCRVWGGGGGKSPAEGDAGGDGRALGPRCGGDATVAFVKLIELYT